MQSKRLKLIDKEKHVSNKLVKNVQDELFYREIYVFILKKMSPFAR